MTSVCRDLATNAGKEKATFTFVLAKSPWTNLLQAGYVHILVMTPEKAQPSEMFAFHELTSHNEQTDKVKSDFPIMRTYYGSSNHLF